MLTVDNLRLRHSDSYQLLTSGASVITGSQSRVLIVGTSGIVPISTPHCGSVYVYVIVETRADTSGGAASRHTTIPPLQPNPLLN